MKKILHIISSPRGNESFSIKLGRAVVDKIKSKFPESEVTERNLIDDSPSHLGSSHINAFFKPLESRTAIDQKAVKYSDVALDEVCKADFLVIGAPMYNFGIHSSLKAWIDHIVRAGISFKYSANGFEGLLTGKKVYLAVASGSVYSEGPMQPRDFVIPYMKAILGFVGLNDVRAYRIEGTSLPNFQKQDYDKVVAAIEL